MTIDVAEFKQRLKIPAQDTTMERAVNFHRARELEARGQLDDAVNAYKKVLELAPQDAVGYVRLASLYVQRGVPRAAVMVYVALAEMHVGRERWEKAAHAYEKAAELAPDDAEVRTALRDVYIKLGRLRDASKVQERIDRMVNVPKRSGPEVTDALPRMPVPPAAPPGNGEPPASTISPPASQALPISQAFPTPVAEPPKVEPKRPVPPPPADKARPKSDRPQQPPPRERPVPSGRPQPVPPPKEAEPAGRRPRARTESLGQILLDEKMVSREQLDKAIQMQQRSGGHLGRILVEQGVLTEQQLAKVLSIQWGLPYLEIGSMEIDPEVVKVIPSTWRTATRSWRLKKPGRN